MNRLFRAPSSLHQRMSAYHDTAREHSPENPLGNNYPWCPGFRFDCVGLTAKEIRQLLSREVGAEQHALRRLVPLKTMEDVSDVRALLDLIVHTGAIPRPLVGRLGQIPDAHLNHFVRSRDGYRAEAAHRSYSTRSDAEIPEVERQEAERCIAALMDMASSDSEEI